MTSKWIDYGAHSLKLGGGADLAGPDMNYIRKDVIDNWDDYSDVVHIDRIAPGLPTVGYIAFNRRRGYYHWISAKRVCREFDPATGKLGKVVQAPKAVMDVIKAYEKKMAENVAKMKAKSAKKKTPAKRRK